VRLCRKALDSGERGLPQRLRTNRRVFAVDLELGLARDVIPALPLCIDDRLFERGQAGWHRLPEHQRLAVRHRHVQPPFVVEQRLCPAQQVNDGAIVPAHVRT
jgi:hypothetical protein